MKDVIWDILIIIGYLGMIAGIVAIDWRYAAITGGVLLMAAGAMALRRGGNEPPTSDISKGS